MTARTLEVRLTEYAASLKGLATQLTEIVAQVEAARQDVNPETQPLRDSIRMYNLVADDIEKILAGEELKPFVIVGNLDLS